MAEVIGVENLKKLLKFSCDLTKQINTAMSDGWSFSDIFGFVDEAAAIPGIAKSFPAISKELADLSKEEKAELETYLQEEFDIPNDSLETVIENSIMQAVSLVALVNEWKNIKK